jgi:predicted transcriptional regulator of viral defense system
MNPTVKSYDYLEEYLDSLRSKGRYAFSLEEAKMKFGLSDKALNQNLFRLKLKRKIVQIRKGFYAIIPPEYAAQGMIPYSLFISDMMKILGRKYYVGLVSAAAIQGAAHQQPMETFIVIEKPALRDIKSKKLKINFLVKAGWSNDDIIQAKTDAGYINVSSPELTALDLLYYIKNIGINRIATILRELVEEIKPAKLQKTVKSFTQVAAIQRLGYLLDVHLRNEQLSEATLKALMEKRPLVIPLVPGKEATEEVNIKWKIIPNAKIELDI